MMQVCADKRTQKCSDLSCETELLSCVSSTSDRPLSLVCLRREPLYFPALGRRQARPQSSNLLVKVLIPGCGFAHALLVAMETLEGSKQERNRVGDVGISGSVETKRGATNPCPVCFAIERLLVRAL